MQYDRDDNPGTIRTASRSADDRDSTRNRAPRSRALAAPEHDQDELADEPYDQPRRAHTDIELGTAPREPEIKSPPRPRSRESEAPRVRYADDPEAPPRPAPGRGAALDPEDAGARRTRMSERDPQAAATPAKQSSLAIAVAKSGPVVIPTVDEKKDLFYFLSICLLCLFILAAVFHGHRRSQYANTPYWTYATLSLVEHCVAFALIVLTMLAVNRSASVYSRPVVLGFFNVSLLLVSASSFDLSRKDYFLDNFVLAALVLQLVGVLLLWAFLSAVIYHGVDGAPRPRTTELSAYERRELEVSRSVINDLENEITRLTARIADIRSGTTNLAMNKQSIIDDKNKRIQELLSSQERLLAQLAEQRAQLAELDDNATRKQLIDLRRSMMAQKDRDEELVKHLREEASTLREQLAASHKQQLDVKQQLGAALGRIAALTQDSRDAAAAARGLAVEKDTVAQAASVQESLARIRVVELQADLDKAREQARNCASCRQWRDKYEHLQRQQLDHEKTREDAGKLRRKLDAVSKQLVIARRLNEMHENFMGQKAAHLDDELKKLSSTLDRDRQPGGGAGGLASPGAGGRRGTGSSGGGAATINQSTGSMAGLGGVNTSLAGSAR